MKSELLIVIPAYNEEENIEYIDKLREGDNILYIEDTKINSSQDVYDILNKLKKISYESIFTTANRVDICLK